MFGCGCGNRTHLSLSGVSVNSGAGLTIDRPAIISGPCVCTTDLGPSSTGACASSVDVLLGPPTQLESPPACLFVSCRTFLPSRSVSLFTIPKRRNPAQWPGLWCFEDSVLCDLLVLHSRDPTVLCRRNGDCIRIHGFGLGCGHCLVLVCTFQCSCILPVFSAEGNRHVTP